MNLQEEFTIEGYDFTFRPAKMNAIDVLAIQTQFNFDGITQSRSSITNALENLEVKAGDQWTPVKIKGREVYSPQEVEEDVRLVSKLVTEFSKRIIKPVFTKSGELNR